MKLVVRTAAVAAAVALVPAYAGMITYSNLADFQAAAAIPAANNITFQGIAALGGQTHYDNVGGFVPAGSQVQFLGCNPSCDNTSSYSLTIDNAVTPNFNFWGSTSPNSVLRVANSYVLQANMLSSSTAVGFDAMTAFAFAQNVSITVVTSAGSETFNNIATQQHPTEQFWGVTTDDPIIHLVIQSPTAANVFIDNFMYGQSNIQVPQVPEAATSLLIGGGLMLLYGLRKLFPYRRNRNSCEPLRQ
jgi:hypothetical protein